MLSLSFIVYLVAIAAIAVLAWRRTRTIADYVLGGRRLSAPVAALSAGASDMSAWLLLGLPGLAVVAPGVALWTAVGLLFGTWCNWRFIAAPLRAASASSGALTLPEFFAQRFPSHAVTLRVIAGITILIFFLLYTSAGLVAGGKLFSSVFAVPYPYAVALSALLVLAYTLVGGFLAVAWTDVLQALLMASMLGAVALILTLAPEGSPDPSGLLTSSTSLAVVSALAWGLGYMGQPHILTRFMAMDASQSVARARHVALAWTAFGLVAAVLIGIYGGALIEVGQDPERVFIRAAESRLLPVFSGLCLAAILAAIMSTADSQLLITAATLTEDLLPLMQHKALSDTRRLRTGRSAVALICVLAAGLALDPQAGVLALVARAWAGFGATLGPALIIALYAPRASGLGAITAMICGGLVVLIWPQLPAQGYAVYELLPAFGIALCANLLVNYFNPGRLVQNGVEAQDPGP